MVFHEIGSITDVLNGHRIIIYYIEGKSEHLNKNDVGVRVFTCTNIALEMLQKKNDDLLIIRIALASESFKQFEAIYQPEVSENITLFAVNNEGIPILSKQINKLMQLSTVIEQISIACNLNPVPSKDIGLLKLNSKSGETFPENFHGIGENNKDSDMFLCSNVSKVSSVANSEIKSAEVHHYLTKLQIRLPSGSREEEKFASDATLQEVWITISTKYNIKDFDLKTYNHPIFSESDYERTLQELDLCPSGVVIVVSKTMTSFNNGRGLIVAIMEGGVRRVMSSTTFAFQYIQGLFVLFFNYFFPSNNGSAPRKRGHNQIESANNNSDHQSSSQSAKRYVSKNIGNNIHTLRRSEDSDDENNRYNGNSTQQK